MVEETVVEEKQTAEEQAAEKAFAAGFDGTRVEPAPEKTVTQEATTPPAEKKETPPAGKALTDTPPASSIPQEVQNLFGQLDHRFKSLEGRVGRVLTEIEKATKATKQAGEPTPSKEQIATAQASLKKWNALKTEFPEWGEAIDEIRAADRAEFTKLIPQVDVDGIRREMSSVAELARVSAQEARQLALLDLKHDGWEQTITTPEFRQWSYSGGPTEAEVSAYERLKEGTRNEFGQFVVPAQPAKADQMFKEFGLKYPQWWADRGALISSPRAKDAIKLLDAFAEKDKAAAEEAKLKTGRRLEAAVPTKGMSAPPVVGVNDEEAFLKGFSKG